ncbi:periplasmic repressor CpxP [Microbulbifer aggregans]|uniref:Periplasmic repressor CpxP n=1 Tax=Microbulbifer aggregans TaxID=1769779 RepID=A0A1C9WC03_9GAMM|nr:Spy/CpxP family protein refolding chaperone [Microbulbifer aggregans]AOS98674.1 periplasmic repressor CpxP [Microbulbifer aggregans]
MKNWQQFAGSVVLAATIAIPVSGFAFAEKAGQHHSKHRAFVHLASELDLTDEQIARIKAHRQEHREDYQDLRGEYRQLRGQISDAIAAGADEATLARLAEQLGQVQIARAQLKHEQREALAAILTQEQRAELEQLRAERKEKRQQRRERRQIG